MPAAVSFHTLRCILNWVSDLVLLMIVGTQDPEQVSIDPGHLKQIFPGLMVTIRNGGNQSEKYIGLYKVDHETWASFATMHFVGNATLWLPTYEAEHDVDSWQELCVAIHVKFGRDQHHKYLEALEKYVSRHIAWRNTTENLRPSGTRCWYTTSTMTRLTLLENRL